MAHKLVEGGGSGLLPGALSGTTRVFFPVMLGRRFDHAGTTMMEAFMRKGGQFDQAESAVVLVEAKFSFMLRSPAVFAVTRLENWSQEKFSKVVGGHLISSSVLQQIGGA